MIYIASDHRGFEAKNQINEFLKKSGVEVEDLGPHAYDPNDDYPPYAFDLATKVVANNSKGILLCNNGAGVTIAANKVKGARAIYAESVEHARLSRSDDNANILILDILTFDPQIDFNIIDVWLKAEFSNAPRHQRRLNEISEYEDQHFK